MDRAAAILYEPESRINEGSMSNVQWVAALSNHPEVSAQTLFAHVVAAWCAAGYRVAGVISESEDQQAPCAAGHLRDLTSGTQILVRNSGNTTGADAHPMPGAGLAQMLQLVRPQLAQADFVVLSRFGEPETRQGGLWPLFLAATVAGKPVLTTVSIHEKLPFERYAPQVQYVQPVIEDIMRWGDTALRD